MINLNDHRSKKYSQNKEDGIILKIFDLIGVTNKCAIEIGVGNGDECCTRILAENLGFGQLMFDKDHEHSGRRLFKEFISIQNIVGLLEKHGANQTPDVIGVDIDSFDFYILHTILRKFRPRVLIVETNPTFLIEDKVIKLDVDCQDYWAYHGASLAAWHNSLNPLGYGLACHEWNGINAFFILKEIEQVGQIDNFNNLEKLYSEHEGKEGCSLSNYKAYPSSFPILTSIEALELLDEKIRIQNSIAASSSAS